MVKPLTFITSVCIVCYSGDHPDTSFCILHGRFTVTDWLTVPLAHP